MFEVEYTNAFKRDLKTLQKRNISMSELKTVIEILASGKNIPAKYKNHRLKGVLVSKNLFISALKENVLLSLKKELDNVILFEKKCIFATSKMAG